MISVNGIGCYAPELMLQFKLKPDPGPAVREKLKAGFYHLHNAFHLSSRTTSAINQEENGF